MSVYIYVAAFNAHMRVSRPELVIEHSLVQVRERIVNLNGESGEK
jgi:hypothetical protein